MRKVFLALAIIFALTPITSANKLDVDGAQMIATVGIYSARFALLAFFAYQFCRKSSPV